ncbi:hypothetical protein M0811_04568 [Anaeramoeba ignava]|uniref:BTB domain-containing protein n=1 Tax=Anaeramoeba ignava TaxID=1746090 RepID=A0A9Q0LWZ9_ANAIG|nr:hypothetical protein M0811_04568 [Anaeramoeba ignava]
MKEFQENKLILKDVSNSILSSILNYLYSGKIKINLENAIQILIFSSKYLIDELIEVCFNFIKKNTQIETVVDILKLSDSMNFNQLLDSSYQFISKNFNEFIKTPFFLELEENHLNSLLLNDKIRINEFLFFQSIIKWGKHKSNINQEKEKKKNYKIKFQILLIKSDLFIFQKKNIYFSLRNDKNDRKPERFTIKKGKEENAIYYDQNFAPNFGEDLEFYSDFQPIQSNFGESYNLPNGIKYGTDKAKSYLAGSLNKWEVDDIETYFI